MRPSEKLDRLTHVFFGEFSLLGDQIGGKEDSLPPSDFSDVGEENG